MKPKNFRLALLQLKVRGGDKKRNIADAVALISEAASGGADVALLPECMDLGWTHPSSLTMAEEIPDGKVCRALVNA